MKELEDAHLASLKMEEAIVKGLSPGETGRGIFVFPRLRARSLVTGTASGADLQ